MRGREKGRRKERYIDTVAEREIEGEEEKEDGRVLFSTSVPFVSFPLKLLRWSSGLSGFHVLM